MAEARPPVPRALIAGALLVIAGLVFWSLYVMTANHERHSYAHGGKPPTYVQLHRGVTYGVAIAGGVGREVTLGLSPGTLQCTATKPGQAPGPLDVTAEAQDTKATDRVGWFVSGVDERVHIECAGIGPVFIDNAADAAYDWSGVWIVAASLLLLVGLPLTLSGLRRTGRRAGQEAGTCGLLP
jgi:hypothetical protein